MTTAAALLHVDVRKKLSPAFVLDVGFEAPAGITMLFGASGAGKTTLLDCIAGLTEPDRGHIAISGRTLFDHEARVDVPVAERRVGYVFQTLALFPHLSVEDNIGYGLDGASAGERNGRVAAIAESFRIAHLRARKPNAISGGERQRVALARALVTDPSFLLLDEPLSALDAATKRAIMEDLHAWNQSHGIPILYVTHSRDEVFALGERVIALEQGTIVAEGDPDQVLFAPRQTSVAQLAGFENIFQARVAAVHEDGGTMTCRLGETVALEVPLGHAAAGDAVRIAIRAGDILLAIEQPRGLSARNCLPGKIIALARRDYMVMARVDCGAEFEVHVTPGAQQSLGLEVGKPVWLVIKTHSCHLVR